LQDMNRRLKLAGLVSPSGPIPGEMSFDIVLATTIPYSGSRILLARTDSGEGVAIKISRYPGGARREWTGLLKAHAAGVPVPEPVAFGREPGGKELIVSRWIEGSSLYHARSREAVTRLGRIVRNMHAAVAVSGAEWRRSGRRSFTYYERSLREWRRRGEQLDGDGLTLALLDELAPEMKRHCRTTAPVFSHNDLHDSQALFAGRSSLVLIDFERWTEESPMNDIASYIYHSLRTGASADDALSSVREFLDGYSGDEGIGEHEWSVLKFYLLFISVRELCAHAGRDANARNAVLATHARVLAHVHAWLAGKERGRCFSS
jgi:aminoglycoside phosphotransferase (APT) family kinase protein